MKTNVLFKPIIRAAFLLLCMFSIVSAYGQFTHRGGLHTADDLAFMKSKILAQESPWIDGWNLMLQDPKAQSTYTAVPYSTIGGSNGIRQQAARDATAAYYNFLIWYVTGNTAHGDCAVNILNSWSNSTNAPVTGELFMLPIMMMVQSGELLRTYPGWNTSDIQQFKDMCSNYFYPLLISFRGYCGSWPGWDGPANADLLYIGVLLDDQDIFDDAVDYYQNGTGGGNIHTLIPELATGQISEMGRDQPHAEIGTTIAAEFCQTAYNQGVDLFPYENNLLLKAFEYYSLSNLNNPVPWVPYDDCDDHNFYFISKQSASRVSQSPAYELLYNHYVNISGVTKVFYQEVFNS